MAAPLQKDRYKTAKRMQTYRSWIFAHSVAVGSTNWKSFLQHYVGHSDSPEVDFSGFKIQTENLACVSSNCSASEMFSTQSCWAGASLPSGRKAAPVYGQLAEPRLLALHWQMYTMFTTPPPSSSPSPLTTSFSMWPRCESGELMNLC